MRFSLPLFLVGILLFAGHGCALVTQRPTQSMSDTASAIRAAREVKADTLAPELYRQARELYLAAKREYKFKNFLEAENLSKKSRIFAERAELEAVLNGGERTAAAPDPLGDGAAGGQGAEPPKTKLIDAGYAQLKSMMVEDLPGGSAPSSAPK